MKFWYINDYSKVKTDFELKCIKYDFTRMANKLSKYGFQEYRFDAILNGYYYSKNSSYMDFSYWDFPSISAVGPFRTSAGAYNACRCIQGKVVVGPLPKLIEKLYTIPKWQNKYDNMDLPILESVTK